ncbi:MAG: arsenite methyltransferase [Verrucomicrobiales bacterium]|jgi:arsenite methyltransferase
MYRESVKDRYASAAEAPEAALCCPVEYDRQYLEIIPSEVIEKDYGCGDPSQFLKPGETVLDLGSGTGKICFIASQVVGESGKVVGVDMTDSMLEVARRNAPIIAERTGYANVSFVKGHIEDLALDVDRFDAELGKTLNGGGGAESYFEAQKLAEQLRGAAPLIADDSIDVVVSNCVLNLVDPGSKSQLFQEIFRVLKRGGRAVISDIVADEPVPEHLEKDAELWSGCISGAMTEEGFLEAFEEAGFHGIELLKFETAPWRTVEGIDFRSVTVQAWKGKEGACIDKNHAILYKGPFSEVRDDDGHTFPRGVRVAVCEKLFDLFKSGPYTDSFEFIEPTNAVSDEDARPFSCKGAIRRAPNVTKGEGYTGTSESADAESCCC